MDELENLIQQLEELKALRDRLTAVDNAEELDENSADIREYLKDEIDIIDKEIKELEENSKKKAKEYEKYYDKLKAVIEENEKKLEETNLLSEEEIAELRYSTENQKLEINKKSQEAKKSFDEYERVLIALKRKKTEISNRIKQSEALGLNYNEYKEIFATIRSRKVMNKIYVAKGLESIIAKKASERTKEEKKLLKQAKAEAMAEIGSFRRKNDDHSVLESIEAIYLLDTNVKKGKEPTVYKMNQVEIDNSKANIKEFAHKIKDSSIKAIAEVKEEIPEDMENATKNVKVDIDKLKPAQEKITLFKDKDTNEYYVRRYAVDRFKLGSVDFVDNARISGSLCYKISASDVEKIKENANNEFSPYITDEKEVTVTKEIPGTKIKKPRDRKVGEEPKDYEDYLTEYFGGLFPEEEKEELTEDEIKDVIEEKSQPEKITEEEITAAVKEVLNENDTEPVKEEDLGEPIKIEEPNDGFYITSDEPKEEELTEDDIISVIENDTEPAIPEIDIEEELTYEDISEAVSEGFEEKNEYTAENIEASEEFKDELKQGNVLYNIIHAVPKVIKNFKGKIKGLFQPDHRFDDIEEPIEEDKPKQR